MNLDDLISLNTSGYNTQAVGQVLGAFSHYQFGQSAEAGAKFKATQLRQNAGTAMAVGERSAADVAQQSQLIASRALAVAAASGGGASDPGVVTLMAHNAQIGAYKQASALYAGVDHARALNLQADATEYEGKATALNSDEMAAAQVFGAGTTMLKRNASNASLYQRFGAGNPSIPSE